jgi:hypothetical protein
VSPAPAKRATSRVVSWKSAQYVAGEAHFQSGAKNVGGWAGPGISLEVVEVEQQQEANTKQRVRVEDKESSHAFAISYKSPIAC